MKTEKTSSPDEEDGGRDKYHHGALRAALMRAADDILLERGPEGFSLREAARRAGVSPGAPAHHFGSVAGLLTEVAIDGFTDLTRAMREAGEAEANPAERIRAQGVSYVQFALSFPGRFQLMFRHDLLLAKDERLEDAGKAALAELEGSIRAYLSGSGPANDQSSRALLLGAWSTVHGFAHLALDGKFEAIAYPHSLADFVSQTLPDVLLATLPDR